MLAAAWWYNDVDSQGAVMVHTATAIPAAAGRSIHAQLYSHSCTHDGGSAYNAPKPYQQQKKIDNHTPNHQSLQQAHCNSCVLARLTKRKQHQHHSPSQLPANPTASHPVVPSNTPPVGIPWPLHSWCIRRHRLPCLGGHRHALSHGQVVPQPHAPIVLLWPDDLGVRIRQGLPPVGTVADNTAGKHKRNDGYASLSSL